MYQKVPPHECPLYPGVFRYRDVFYNIGVIFSLTQLPNPWAIWKGEVEVHSRVVFGVH